jgi:hypothetical protein
MKKQANKKGNSKKNKKLNLKLSVVSPKKESSVKSRRQVENKAIETNLVENASSSEMGNSKSNEKFETESNKNEKKSFLPLIKPKTDKTSNDEANNSNSSYQLDKRQRFEIYKRRLAVKPSAKSADEAIDLINKTLVEIEDRYAPKADDKIYNINSKKYGRMYPVPKDRIIINPQTGQTELLTTGIIVYVNNNGSFEMWTKQRGAFMSKKLFHKNGIS